MLSAIRFDNFCMFIEAIAPGTYYEIYSIILWLKLCAIQIYNKPKYGDWILKCGKCYFEMKSIQYISLIEFECWKVFGNKGKR